MPAYNKDFLALVYQEINLHLRHAGDKRDRILSIYIAFTATILGFLVGNKESVLVKNQKDMTIITFVSLIALILIGEIITWSIVSYRKWHAEYMNCAIVISEMSILESHSIDKECIRENKSENYKGSFFTSKSFRPRRVSE